MQYLIPEINANPPVSIDFARSSLDLVPMHEWISAYLLKRPFYSELGNEKQTQGNS